MIESPEQLKAKFEQLKYIKPENLLSIKQEEENIRDIVRGNDKLIKILMLYESIKNKDWKDITFSDFELIGYFPHPSIKMDMAI